MTADSTGAPRPGGDPPRSSGALYVHLQSEGGVDHRTLVLSPGTAAMLRRLWSWWGLALALALGGSWVYFGIESARVPLLTRRVAELEAEARRIDTLQARLQTLQVQYDQVHRMLGVPIADSTKREQPPAAGRKQ